MYPRHHPCGHGMICSRGMTLVFGSQIATHFSKGGAQKSVDTGKKRSHEGGKCGCAVFCFPLRRTASPMHPAHLHLHRALCECEHEKNISFPCRLARTDSAGANGPAQRTYSLAFQKSLLLRIATTLVNPYNGGCPTSSSSSSPSSRRFV